VSDVIGHLEFHLGAIKGGWFKDADGAGVPFPVARFDGPFPDSIVLATIGLSRLPLRSRVSGKAIHQELIMVFRSSEGPLNLPGVLQQLAEELGRAGTALLRGDVIGNRGTVVVGSELNALYIAPPSYFPHSFRSLAVSGGPTVVFSWLVPITKEEAQFIAQEGWERFEDVLEELDPDLLDLTRKTFLPV
jgi:hypothetical protein